MPTNIIAEEIEKAELIDNRFRDAVWVNTPDEDGNKAGFFSLIFRAYDIVEDRQAALKFFDITAISCPYRLAAFEREPDILKKLIGRPRCLQLASDLSVHIVNIRTDQGNVLPVPCKFFATEWLDHDLDNFFLNQHTIETRAKLELFTDIVLAVEALHRNDIHHRDIKPENLKIRTTDTDNITVAIDFGTAARTTTPSLKQSYEDQVGDRRYSSPESFCGLSGHRKIGKYTDIFGLGCILFELFDYREYWKVFSSNATIDRLIQILRATTIQTKDIDLRLSTYNRAITPLRRAAPQPIFEREKSTAPACIISLLNNLLRKLTAFDYRQREISFDRVRKSLNSMVTVVDNERLQAHLLAQKRLIRTRRRQKLLDKQNRLEKLLKDKRG